MKVFVCYEVCNSELVSNGAKDVDNICIYSNIEKVKGYLSNAYDRAVKDEYVCYKPSDDKRFINKDDFMDFVNCLTADIRFMAISAVHEFESSYSYTIIFEECEADL